MKKLLFLLIFILSGICYAQNYPVQYPEVTFKSVNTYNMGGAYTGEITPVMQYSEPVSSGPRKVKGDPTDPFPTPIGDLSLLEILCFGGAFILYKARPRRSTL